LRMSPNYIEEHFPHKESFSRPPHLVLSQIKNGVNRSYRQGRVWNQKQEAAKEASREAQARGRAGARARSTPAQRTAAGLHSVAISGGSGSRLRGSRPRVLLCKVTRGWRGSGSGSGPSPCLLKVKRWRPGLSLQSLPECLKVRSSADKVRKVSTPVPSCPDSGNLGANVLREPMSRGVYRGHAQLRGRELEKQRLGSSPT